MTHSQPQQGHARVPSFTSSFWVMMLLSILIVFIINTHSLNIQFVLATTIPPKYSITTIAGGGNTGASDATSVVLNGPSGISIGSDGVIYFTEKGNNQIRKLSFDSNTGTYSISTFDTSSLSPAVDTPTGIFVKQDSVNGDVIYFADNGRVTSVANGVVQTIHDKTSDANFNPSGLSMIGGDLYVADSGNQVIDKWTSNVYNVYAGSTGTAGYQDADFSADPAAVQFNNPVGVATTNDANPILYVADKTNNRIRKLFQSASTTFAGSGK